ncbi:MAG: NAD-dependent epimerase/dehydratase family protein [Vicinamibacterales bacterium]
MPSGRCLVTGATGFVGRVLVDRLVAGGSTVRGLSRSSPARSHADLLHEQDHVAIDLSVAPPQPHIFDGVDTVYHLAAKTHDSREGPGSEGEYWRLNVTATEALLRAMEGSSVRRVVFASSVKAVDEGGPVEVDETKPPAPETAYGKSKRAAEERVMEAGLRGGFEAVCVRLPLVYGPGQKGNLQRMMAAIERGRFPPPPHTPNRRSLLHVDNAVDALVLAGAHHGAAGQIYFVTDAAPYSTRQIYDAMREALGLEPGKWSVPEAAFRALAATGDVARRALGRRVGFDSDAFQKLLGSAWYSSAKIARELGYRPVLDLRGSMPAIVASYRSTAS